MGPRRTYRACGYQQITSLASAASLTIPTVAPDGGTCKPNAILIGSTAQNVRWRDDGTAPTATVGNLLISAQQPFYYDGDLSRIRFIEAAASAVLNVAYYEDVNAT
jgi:hypothetical protein